MSDVALRVRDIMSRDLFLISEDVLLVDAAFQLNAELVGAAPVHDAAGRVVGIISKTDIVDIERDHETMGTQRVKDVMHAAIRTVPFDAKAQLAAELMSEHSLHRVVVVDAEGSPLGIVSSMDIVHAVARGDSFA